MNLKYIDHLFDKIQEPIMIITSDLYILSCNQFLLVTLNYEAAEVIHKKISFLFPDEKNADNFAHLLFQMCDKKNSIEIRSTIRTNGKTEVPVTWKASLFYKTSEGIQTYLISAQLCTTLNAASHHGTSDFFEKISFPVLRISRDGVILHANKGSWIILSFWNKTIGQYAPTEFINILNTSDSSPLSNDMELQIGFKFYLLAVISDSDSDYTDLFFFDITRRKHAEQKLQLDAQVFESAFEGIMITDVDQRILDVNSAFCTITGYTREEILGENASILQSGKHGDDFYRNLWESVIEKGSWQGEVWDRKKNGNVYPKWLSISSVTGGEGKVTRYIGLFSDITVIKETEEKLFHMANYDALTNLVNRRYFQDHLEKNLQQSRRSNEMLALMFIDLDGFKLINDNFGHQIGDQALRIVADRLKECVREADIVARMGGDEFTIILPFIKNSQNIVLIAEKILKHIIEPLKLKNSEHFISTSIGIAIFPVDAGVAEELVQNADTALYRAKEIGKNLYQFFSPEMNTYVKDRLTIKSKIRHGLDNNEFKVFYQPQYDSELKSIVGMEALVRWEPEPGSFVCPDDFIPIAEETGLINEIGEFVLRTVCEQGKLWVDSHILHTPISVNISAIQLRRPDFIKRLSSIITESSYPGSLLEFELTESILIENVADIQNKLQKLKLLGNALIIDDFGTKYSSLSYLKIFPIDKLKIDKSFITDIPQDNSGSDIVKAIIAMGKSLKLKVIAEGVETVEQVEFLKVNGCTIIQGYYFSKAVPAPVLQMLLINEKQKNTGD